LCGVSGGRFCRNSGKERVEESKYDMTPIVPTQPSSLSPQKSVSRLDVLLLLTLGVCAHDVASIYGMHIEGLHAIYFAIPMILILLSFKVKRKLWK